MDKFLNFVGCLGREIKHTVLNKWLDCFVGLAAVALTLAQLIAYCCMPADLFNYRIVIYCVVGIVLFLLLSLFKQTSPLAPIVLMVFDFMCIAAFANTDGMIDYVTTQLFDGFSLSALPAAFVTSVLLFVMSFAVSSVAMYLPKSRKPKAVEKESVPAETAEGEEVK